MIRTLLVTPALIVPLAWGVARAAPPPDGLQVHPAPRALPALELDDGGAVRAAR